MKLSVVIVNYNVCHHLAQCLSSLYKALEELYAEVFVVDNASTDGSQEYITERFPQLTYIYNKVNCGFARACNQAISKSTGEYVLLLNPDTLLAEDTLTKAIEFMDNHPESGAVGVRMLAADGSFLEESKRGYPTLKATLGKLTGWGKVFPVLKGYYCNDLTEDGQHEVDVLAGAFLMIRSKALEKVGLLDEDFFMYGEDVDFSCRLRNAGFKNYYLPLPIIHYKGASTDKNSIKHVNVFYGAMKIFFKKYAVNYNLIQRGMVYLGISLFALLQMLNIKLCRPWLKLFNPLFRSSTDYSAYRFLVLGSEESIYSLRKLFDRYGLDGNHNYVVANEISTIEGHGGMLPDVLQAYTHVVYDSSCYSFSTIIKLMLKYRACGISLGIYDPKSHVLLIPEHCFE